MAEEPAVAIKPEDLYPDEGFKEMVEAGVFYGRKKSRTNPKMRPYILTNRNGIEIVNLAKTVEVLDEACAFLRDQARNGKLIFFVATQPAAESVAKLANDYSYPLVTRRWLGGTLTNFKIISKRIEYFKTLRANLGTSAFEKYTKKERLMFEKELARLTELMGGLEHLIDRPAVLVVVDPNLHTTAMNEARLLKIPVIAFMNTDSDPDLAQFPVVGNNKARMSITWFIEKLRAAIAEGKAMGSASAEASSSVKTSEDKTADKSEKAAENSEQAKGLEKAAENRQ